jgi:HSP20 family protein
MENHMNKLHLPDVFGRRAGTGLDMFRSLQREIDHLFDDFSRGMPSFGNGGEGLMAMKLDMAETGKSFEVTADLPGASPENIDVSLKDDMLTIRAETKAEKEDKNKNFHLHERSYGMFQRSIMLPAGVDAEKIDARFDKGVLKISLPKLPEAETNVRKISVKATS